MFRAEFRSVSSLALHDIGDCEHLYFYLGDRLSGCKGSLVLLGVDNFRSFLFRRVFLFYQFFSFIFKNSKLLIDSNFIITALYNDSYEWHTVLTLLEAGRITAWIVLVTGTISFIQCLIGLCCWPDQKVSPSEIELQVDPAIANLPLEYQQEAIEHRKKELEKEMVQ